MNLPQLYQPYALIQALDVFPFLDFTPAWLLDCGPGLGVEAYQFKNRYPEIKIIGFEPDEETYQLIKVEYPGELHNCALGDLPGEAHLYGAGMGTTLVPQHIYKTERLTRIVVPKRWHPWFSTVEKAVLWADVEGWEREILHGCRELIACGKLWALNLEVHDGPDEAATDALCAELGFQKVCSYAGNGAHHDNIYLWQGRNR